MRYQFAHLQDKIVCRALHGYSECGDVALMSWTSVFRLLLYPKTVSGQFTDGDWQKCGRDWQERRWLC